MTAFRIDTDGKVARWHGWPKSGASGGRHRPPPLATDLDVIQRYLTNRSFAVFNTQRVAECGPEGATMSDQSDKVLEAEIAAYEAHHEELRRAYPEDHWVVVKGTEIIGVYADVDRAATAAHEQFGEEPYLLRQVKPIPFVLPSCLIAQESLLA